MSNPVQSTALAATSFDRDWRWWVLGTLFLANFLNYLDRQTLSSAADPICNEFGLDNVQRGQLLAAFVYAYATAHLGIGFFLDRIRNVRGIFPVFVLGWSLTNLLVGFSHAYTTILWLRVLLGFWESANFPMCLLLIARIFPPRERVFASGVFYSGAIFATFIAPKLVIYFSTHLGWRWSFVVTGGLGLFWLVPWLVIFREPARRAVQWPLGADEPSSSVSAKAISVLDILRRPAFWGVVLVGVGIIPGLYFMQQWLPSYLTQRWHMPYNQALGNWLMLISFFQDLGMWLGGVLVWVLARRWRLLTARKAVIGLAYVMMTAILILPRVSTVEAGVILLCFYVFGLGAWLAIQQTFKQDVAQGRVATVAGLVGFAETMVSAFVVERVGVITQHNGGFNGVFILFAGLFTGAMLMVLVFMRERWFPAPVTGQQAPARVSARLV